MKLITILRNALFAIASVEAAAIPDPASNTLTHGILKRAADAVAEAMAEATPSPGRDLCYRTGEPCSKAPEAQAAVDPEARPCFAPGQPCSVAKREALAAAEAVAEAEAIANPDPEAGKSS